MTISYVAASLVSPVPTVARAAAVQVGADVIVFADMDGSPATLDIAVVLVGRTIADIAPTDFA